LNLGHAQAFKSSPLPPRPDHRPEHRQPAPRFPDLEALAERRGFEIVKVFADNVSAVKTRSEFDFSDKFVWSVRSAAKTKGATRGAPASIATAPASKAPTAKQGPGRPKKVAESSDALAVANSLEERLFSLALEVGIARAEAIVQRARQQIDGLRLRS